MRAPDDDSSFPDPSVQDLLHQAEQFFWHGQFSEALTLLDRLETQENVTELERLQGQLLCCRIFATLDVNKAQELADQVIHTSQVLNQPLLHVDACLIMAEAWLELGIFHVSENFLKQGKAALKAISGRTDPDRIERKAKLLALEGGLYAYKGELDCAFGCIQQSVSLREPLDDPQALAHSLVYLGIAYYFKGELKKAINVFQKCQKLREPMKYPQEIAQTLFWLGKIFFWIVGESERTLKYLQETLTIFEDLETLHGIANALNWVGSIQTVIGELDLALKNCQRSLQICSQLDAPGTFAEARTLQIIGLTYNQKGEMERALTYLQQSLALDELRGFKPGQIFTLHGISDVYLNQGQLEKAVEGYLQALKMSEEIGNIQDIAYCLYYLAI